METSQITILESIYALTVKTLHHNNINIHPIITDLMSSLLLNQKPQEGDITNLVAQTLRLLRLCFVERTFDVPQLNTGSLLQVLVPLFHLRLSINDSQKLCPLRNDIEEVLVKLLKKDQQKFAILDSIVFDINCNDVGISSWKPAFEISMQDERLQLKRVDYTPQFSISQRIEVLRSFLKQDLILYIFYCYLLNTLTDKGKYFNSSATKSDLLQIEDTFVINKDIEAQIAICRVLSELSENKAIQDCIKDDPSFIIKFMLDFFTKTIDTNMHKTSEFESNGFHTIFTVTMILQALIESCEGDLTDQYKSLIEPLRTIVQEGSNQELTRLLSAILFKLEGGKSAGCPSNPKSSIHLLERAIEDVTDPLLPVRGHGLLMLSKLVKEKDENAMERKQYIFNIFQVCARCVFFEYYFFCYIGLATK